MSKSLTGATLSFEVPLRLAVSSNERSGFDESLGCREKLKLWVWMRMSYPCLSFLTYKMGQQEHSVFASWEGLS